MCATPSSNGDPRSGAALRFPAVQSRYARNPRPNSKSAPNTLMMTIIAMNNARPCLMRLAQGRSRSPLTMNGCRYGRNEGMTICPMLLRLTSPTPSSPPDTTCSGGKVRVGGDSRHLCVKHSGRCCQMNQQPLPRSAHMKMGTQQFHDRHGHNPDRRNSSVDERGHPCRFAGFP